MLPCQGIPLEAWKRVLPARRSLPTSFTFANAGGRVYSSHYSYAWMFNNPPFNGVANWTR